MSGVFEWIIFLSLSAIAVVMAAGMILTMSMYRAGLALMASFVALAGLFILLNADLLAAIQIMMNVGGMLVMVLFMVMMMMDPGGEMMWGMKRDMRIPGPAAFSMTMPRGRPPADESNGEKEQPGSSQVSDWTCPMHPEVSQPGPGNCPKCGMVLIPRTEMANGYPSQENAAQVYTCPMHPEVRQDQPGTCPKCGMNLIPAEQQPEESQAQETQVYTCPMHPEVHQEQPGKCPKCGINLVPAEAAQEQHGMAMGHDISSSHAMPMNHTAPADDAHMSDHNDHDMNMHNMDMSGNSHAMHMSGHSMNGSGMKPRQYYDMMVDMAMSTAQLPWAIALGALAAILLIILVIQTPWSLSAGGPTQDATTMVGELLLSRYMIGFEGAAFLILAGIAGAVILGKRERKTAEQPSAKQIDTEGAEQQMYTCPMHPEVRQEQPGSCPKCGMALIPAQETPAPSGRNVQGEHT